MSVFMRESEREWRELHAALEKEIHDTRNEVRALTQFKDEGVVPRLEDAMTSEAREQLKNLTERVEEIETGIVHQVTQACETIARQHSRLSAQSGFEHQSAIVALKNDMSLFMRESEQEWREQHAILEKKLEDALREKEARRRGKNADVPSLALHAKMNGEGKKHRQVSSEMKTIDDDACRRALPLQDHRTTGLHCHQEDYTRQPICPSTSFDRLPGDKPSRHSSYGSCAGGMSPTFPPLSPPPLSIVY
ncbi:hypothetical protein CSUI_001801 [Cystoisospora suis]|uniref:Uncharacterized protein n=1 Tax=Cystoisospora suis TaxID=483139 RepID=A0A2C6LAG8_9APIC|nr:hypothetical protein CSUI_001801 [Cystoisospora suis]